MDVDSGAILYRYNANKRLHPASLTKMMTLLLLFDALDYGAIHLNDKIYISKHAASMIPSKIGLEPGSHIRVKDAISALSVKSANDIAVAVAEKLGGSEGKFALMMTKKARELGMTRTRFMNASGLHDSRQVSTARDVAKLSRALVTRYKRHYHHFSKSSFTYQGKTYKSHNRLMQSYAGMDGLKTGYIQASGFNLASSVTRNNRRVIGVVFGGRSGKLRNEHMEKLLDNAFAKLHSTTSIAQHSIPIPGRKPNTQVQMASLSSQRTLPRITTGKTATKTSRWDVLYATHQNSMFNRMIGQGDYDITVRNRIETGLIAISAHLNEKIPSYILHNKKSGYATPVTTTPKEKPRTRTGSWGVQIGAFTTRDNTDKAITQSLQKLPSYLNHGRSTIAPIQTKQGWIYRGRLQGYSKEAAHDACAILNDCIPLSPGAL
ncbi:MAG: serine hydrolase [Alphaproteobacteria bacterium]